MVIDKNKNNQISDKDDDPTMELEPLSEEDCAKMLQSENSPVEPGSNLEIEASHEHDVEADAPVSRENSSAIDGLREQLNYRIEMNSILQQGIVQLREKCDQRAEQIASLEESSERLSGELEQSRKRLEDAEQKLAVARENEQALLIKANTHGQADAANARNAKLLAELEAKNAQIDDYKSQLETLRRSSAVTAKAAVSPEPAARFAPDSQTEDRWALVGQDGDATDSHMVADGIIIIGSSSDCDIQIASQFVSRHHAQLVKTDIGCVLGDLNSTNGTFINSRRINKRVLRADDIVTIGKHRFRYEKQTANSIIGNLREDKRSLDSSGI
ncbi:MAG: FHA domain-containing protein [Woeseiaceae bacterium]|nr:FHA domain-containing protein [Woeseiaceae bacterium]